MKNSKQKSRKYKFKYNLSKFIIWVVRLPKDKKLKETGIFKDAKPCSKCCTSLYELGFRKIAFSTENNEIELIDLRTYRNTHLSNAQKITEKYCRY